MTFYRIARCLLLCCSLTRVKPDHVLTMKTVKTAKTNKPGDRRDERTQPNRAQQIEFQPIPAPHRYVILFKGNLFRVVAVEQPESAAGAGGAGAGGGWLTKLLLSRCILICTLWHLISSIVSAALFAQWNVCQTEAAAASTASRAVSYQQWIDKGSQLWLEMLKGIGIIRTS